MGSQNSSRNRRWIAVANFLIAFGGSLVTTGLLWAWLGGRWWGIPIMLCGFVVMPTGFTLLYVLRWTERRTPKQRA